MLGFNGYATLVLDKQKLCIEYFDIENSNPLVTENWEVDLSNGALTGSIKENKPGILKLPRSVTLEQAVTVLNQ